MLKKKLIGGGTACAIMLNCFLSIPLSSLAAETKYEFEDGTLTGYTEVATSQSGYSGSGYVDLTGDGAVDDHSGDTITVTVTAPSTGMYDLTICASAAYGDGKQHSILVNGVTQGTMAFSGKEFTEYDFGTVKLEEGENTVTVVSGWGWTLFDYLTIDTAELETLNKCNILSDPNATAEAQGLMNFLATAYGEQIISGQQEIYGGGHDGHEDGYEMEFEYLYDLTGEYPAIRGFDFLNTNPMCGWDDGTTERIIDWVNERGGIATASWHLVVPTDFANYEIGTTVQWSESVLTHNTNTDFAVENIVNDPTSKEYQYFMQSVEMLAIELKQLQDAGVPLLFRPFHEAEGAGGETGSWFWWGMDGSTTYKQLWKLLYTTLTEEYGLHNLIWEFNSYTYTKSFNWYPGNEYVDLVGYDKYNASANNPNESAISTTFNSLVDMYNKYGKMIALMECDTIPSVENMTSENAYWLYFCPWYESDAAKFLTEYNNADTLISIYQSETVITLDELPDYKTYEFTGEEFIPATTEATEPPTPTEPPAEGHAELIQEDGYINIEYPEAVGEAAYIVVELDEGVTEASGGLGCNAVVDGTYYWVNTPWAVTESGAVLLDFTNPLNVTLGKDVVTDQSIIDAAIAYVQTQTTFQGQVWNVSGTGEATIVDAYLLGTEDPTEDTSDEEDPTEPDVEEGTVTESTDGVTITLPKAVGETLYLQVEVPADITYANGCVAGNVDVDGTIYWVSVKWEAAKSGDIEVDMTNVYEVSLDGVAIEDEDIIAAASAGLLEQTTLSGQIWWANDATGTEADKTTVAITGAYILSDADTTDPTETTEDTDPTVPEDVVYGDANEDGAPSVADVILINQYYMKTAELSETGTANADVDRDDDVDLTDSMNILKSLIDLVTLPVQ